jgi:hypothetical protein
MSDLDAEIKARVSTETKLALADIAKQQGEGVKISDVLRNAVGEFLARHGKISAREIVEYKVAELRIAEDPKEQHQPQM